MIQAQLDEINTRLNESFKPFEYRGVTLRFTGWKQHLYKRLMASQWLTWERDKIEFMQVNRETSDSAPEEELVRLAEDGRKELLVRIDAEFGDPS